MTPPVPPVVPAQIPIISVSPQFGPEKITGGFIWAVQFQLPVPAANDGIIVQEVFQLQTGETAAGVATSLTVLFWEAWEIVKGATAPTTQQTIAHFLTGLGGTAPSDPRFTVPFNDIFFRQFSAGGRGSMHFLSSAGFYETSLPPNFRLNNPQTGAGSLPSTTTRPTFWADIGVFRSLKFDFDFRVARTTANSTLRTVVRPSGNVFHTNPPDAEYTTHT